MAIASIASASRQWLPSPALLLGLAARSCLSLVSRGRPNPSFKRTLCGKPQIAA